MTSPEQSPENSFSMLKLPDSSIVAKGSIFPFWLCLPSSSQICQAQEPKLSATSVISDCHDSGHWCPATNTALVLCRSSWHCSPPHTPHPVKVNRAWASTHFPWDAQGRRCGWTGRSQWVAAFSYQGQRPERSATEAAQGWDSHLELGEAGPAACSAFVWPCSPFQCSPHMEWHNWEKQSTVQRITCLKEQPNTWALACKQAKFSKAFTA